jgi:hypothetical protein
MEIFVNWHWRTVIYYYLLIKRLADNDAVIQYFQEVKDIEWVVTRPFIILDEESRGIANRSVNFEAIPAPDVARANFEILQDSNCSGTCDTIGYYGYPVVFE